MRTFSKLEKEYSKKNIHEAKCEGPCGKIIKNLFTPMCVSCDMIVFPYTNCETCTNQVRKISKCEQCITRETSNKYLDDLITKFGPIDPDYEILLNIEGTGYCHTGYSCYTPLEIEDVEINEQLYLPVFKSAISEFKLVSDELNTNIDTIKFTNSSEDDIESLNKFPVLQYYIYSLLLTNIHYQGICGCCGLYDQNNEPHVVSIALVKNKKNSLTTFYSLTIDQNNY